MSPLLPINNVEYELGHRCTGYVTFRRMNGRRGGGQSCNPDLVPIASSKNLERDLLRGYEEARGVLVCLLPLCTTSEERSSKPDIHLLSYLGH
jgi:hypothetical protein